MTKATMVVAMILLVGCGTPEPTGESGTPGVGTAVSGRVDSFDGVPIAYTVSGRGQGALLFIHGWRGSSEFWAPQVAEFSREQTVVTVDLAGHGRSGSDRREWTIESLARDVEAVIDALDLESVVVVGHSMGGAVALETAIRAPDRVVGVVVVDALQNVERRRPANWNETLAAYRSDFTRRCHDWARELFVADSDPELVGRITSSMCDATDGQVAIALLEALNDYDLAAALNAVTVPVRAINGTRWPTRIEIDRRYDPDFDALIVQGTGHFPMLERPVEFDGLLRQVVEEITAGATT